MEHLEKLCPDARKVIVNMAKTARCPMYGSIMSSAALVKSVCKARRARKYPYARSEFACMSCAAYEAIEKGQIPEWITIKEIDMPQKATVAKCVKCGKEGKIKTHGICTSCCSKEYRAQKIVCSVCGKEENRYAKGMCKKCYAMMKNHPAGAVRAIHESPLRESPLHESPLPNKASEAAAIAPSAITPTYSSNPAFDALLRRMGRIHDAKRRDYANDNNPLGNFEAARMLGVTPLTGILIRMTDKFTRVCNLSRQGAEQHVADESLEDTLIDLANYSLLALLSRRQEEKI